MNFVSTRNLNENINSTGAIIKGISDSGGLYVPEKFPDFEFELEKLKILDYQGLAFEIIKAFFSDINEIKLKNAIKNAYDGKLSVCIKNDFLELFHGPTSAFKDVALLFLPQIMSIAKEEQKIKNKILVLTATSGDTGKAALEGFSDTHGIDVLVLYPKDGVSTIQERQMVSHNSKNGHVISINGNFDDAQTCVKNIFASEEMRSKLLEEGYVLSSANSINIGRLIPQIVYYFYGYLQLVNKGSIKFGEKINVCVPTGNFGNILAAYYAKKMNLPIQNFICASNENNVLTDFINTGIYDKRRELILTDSPSMDILVSSNLERLLFEISNRDDSFITNIMEQLKNDGYYQIDKNMKNKMNDFYGYYSTKEGTYSSVKDVFNNKNYLMDTHTAVAYNAYEQYKLETNDRTKTLIVSTASPYKFAKSIAKALNIDEEVSDFEILNILENNTKVEIPKNLKNLDTKKIIHNLVCEKNTVNSTILDVMRRCSNGL